jgi:hypothetical protein
MLEVWLKWQSSFIACVRPWVHSSVLKKKKKKELGHLGKEEADVQLQDLRV